MESAPAAPLRLTRFHFGEWEPLGGEVTLDLAPRCTVLVGKNGAGKSLLCEGLYLALHYLDELADAPLGILRFAFEFGRTDADGYRFERTMPSDDRRASGGDFLPIETGPDERVSAFTESFTRADGEPIWDVRQGKLRVSSSEAQPWPDVSPLRHLRPLTRPLAVAASDLLALCKCCARIAAGGLNRRFPRAPIVLNKTPKIFRYPSSEDPQVGQLAVALAMAHQLRKERLQEFVELGKSLGLWQDLQVAIYRAQKSEDLARVLFDGVDIGLLADGTLRVAEILWHLVNPTITPLIIEEPETAVHPGLLWKLLSVFDSYAAGRQFILSTHSPQVVSWAQPEELRLVERRGGATQVRSLSADQLQQVKAYLDDHDQTLGEYVFAGALDQDGGEAGDGDGK